MRRVAVDTIAAAVVNEIAAVDYRVLKFALYSSTVSTVAADDGDVVAVVVDAGNNI